MSQMVAFHQLQLSFGEFHVTITIKNYPHEKDHIFRHFINAVDKFRMSASAQNNKPYTEGPVWMVQFIQTKPGMSQLYLNNLNEGWIKEMKQAKTEGLIMDYKVLSGVPGSKNDWDLMLLFEIKNYGCYGWHD